VDPDSTNTPRSIDAGIDDAARDRVIVSGPDAGSYLHGQLAQTVESRAVGERRWTLVLEPDGKICVLARIAREAADRYVLDTDAGFGDELAGRIRRFMIRVDAEVSNEAAERSAPDADHETQRVAAGWPRMGTEIEAGTTIPATTGTTVLAVDFRKGCYPGQELIERMDSRGVDAPRSLRIIDVDGNAAAGDPIVDADGTEVGVLTSVAGGLGLGYVKRGASVGRAPDHVDGAT
jgi:folate-binding protein YgfZ